MEATIVSDQATLEEQEIQDQLDKLYAEEVAAETKRKEHVNTIIGLGRRFQMQPDDVYTTAEMYLKFKGFKFDRPPSQKAVMKLVFNEVLRMEMSYAIAALEQSKKAQEEAKLPSEVSPDAAEASADASAA